MLNAKSRSRRRRGFAKIAVVAGIGLAAVAVFAGLFAWLITQKEVDPSLRLSAGLRLLKKGKPHEARLLVASVPVETIELGAEQAKQYLILGAASLDEAEKLESPRFSYGKAMEAEENLSKAGKLGFPRGYEGLGSFLLGKVFYRLFRWDEAEEPLERAVSEWPDGRTDALECLIDIQLGHKPMRIDAAREWIDEWAHMPGLTDEERNLGAIKALELSLAAGDTAKLLEQHRAFPRESIYAPRADYLAARSKLEKLASVPTSERAAAINDIESTLMAVVKNSNAQWGVRRKAEYYLGLNQLRDDRLKAALTTFISLRQKAPESIEGVMASIEEMQILLELGKYEEVANTLKHIKSQFGKLEWYRNAWVSFDEMRDRINRLGRGLLDKNAFAETIAFSDCQPPFCQPVDRLVLLSEASRRWAESLRGRSLQRDVLMDIRESEKNRVAYDDMNRRQQELYSQAAKAYETLARLELRSPKFLDRIWLAIDCSQSAGELAYCNDLISQAMAYEDRNDAPRSLIKIAENHYAMQQPDKALATLERCMTMFNAHPLTFNARLNAARILNEEGRFETAVEHLEENLYLSQLTPENVVWRESLYELGKSLYRQGEILYVEAERLKNQFAGDPKTKRLEMLEQAYGHFLKSIDRLEQWIERFPEDQRRFDTLYCIGQAYQMAAQWPRVLVAEKQLPTEELNRGKLLEQRRLLDSARKTFKQIRDGMSTAQEWSSLEPSQQRLLRNSYFAEADLLFKAKNFDGALSAYRNIANRLVNEPESLEALVQVAECLKALGRREESIGVVAQAREVLQQIPPQRDEQFGLATRFTRTEWAKHLDWMSNNQL